MLNAFSRQQLIRFKMRIVIGTFSHETNVFSKIRTDLEQFRSATLIEGRQILHRFKGTQTPIGGFIEAASQKGFELIPTICAEATPSGKITDEAYEFILDRLLDGIREAEHVDGVLLDLHGAAVSESHDDVEGEVLSRIRREMGDETPIACELDLHCNLTPLMVKCADIIVGYDTYPHIDTYERGIEASNLLLDVLNDRLTPTKAVRKPPMMMAVQAQVTDHYPMSHLMAAAHAAENIDDVINVTVTGGFPWSDIKDVGLGILVTTNGNSKLAEELATRLSDLAWSLRNDFLVKPTPLREGIARAKEAKNGPIVLADIGDSPAGGTSEDGTVVLKAMLDMEVDNAVVALIYDPEAVAKAIEAGVGKEVTMNVGGKIDLVHGEPLKVTGRVKLISDGRFVNTNPMGGGVESEMGRTVVLHVNGIDVIMAERRTAVIDLELYRSLGIEPTRKKVIVVKSSVQYRAVHQPIAKQIIELDTPGLMSPRFAGFSFKKVRRPIFPLDGGMPGIVELKTMAEE
jgi:microcystin degradation protein MlrC